MPAPLRNILLFFVFPFILEVSVAPGFLEKTKYSLYVHLGCPNTHILHKLYRYQSKVLYYIVYLITLLLHRLCTLATLIHKRKKTKTEPYLPQGRQLVNVGLELQDTSWWLFSSGIWYPSGIFIMYKASVSAPCLARITKGSMKSQRLDTV
jgi:hypothetical protein